MSRIRTRPKPETDPIALLTTDVLQHLAAAHATEVDARAEVGRLLGELKGAMNHGEWLFFIADSLPLSPASVKRAMQLHAFSQSQPEKFAELRSLGLTKSYALMGVSPAQWEAFFAVPTHWVRRSIPKSPLQMTFAEMLEVLNGPPKKEAAPVKMVKAVKRFAKGLLTSVTALLDLPGFDGSDELMDSLDVIADETQRVVALLPQALAAS